jgi:hypothetical protein
MGIKQPASASLSLFLIWGTVPIVASNGCFILVTAHVHNLCALSQNQHHSCIGLLTHVKCAM